MNLLLLINTLPYKLPSKETTIINGWMIPKSYFGIKVQCFPEYIDLHGLKDHKSPHIL